MSSSNSSYDFLICRILNHRIPSLQEIDEVYDTLWQATRALAMEEMMLIPALGMRGYRLAIASVAAGEMILPSEYEGNEQNPTGLKGSYLCRDCPTRKAGVLVKLSTEDNASCLVRLAAAILAMKMPELVVDTQRESAPCLFKYMNRDLIDEFSAHRYAAQDYHTRQIGLFMKHSYNLKLDDRFMGEPFRHKGAAEGLKSWSKSDSMRGEAPDNVYKKGSTPDDNVDNDDQPFMAKK